MASDPTSTILPRLTWMAAAAVSAAMLLAGCGTSSGPAAEPDSGIIGRTVVDGGCPVLRDGTPCPDRLIAAKVTVTRPGDGKTVVTFSTGEDGSFRVRLAAGSYVLHATNKQSTMLPAAGEVPVTVVSGQFQTITINFDTGIR